MNLINVSGQVRSTKTATGIPYVNIEKMLNGQPTGSYVQSDSNGNFNIPVMNFNGLRFTHAEYGTDTYAESQLFEGLNVIWLTPKNIELPDIPITIPPKKAANNTAGLGILAALLIIGSQLKK